MYHIMPLQATYSQLPVQNGKATSGDQVWHVQFYHLNTVPDESPNFDFQVDKSPILTLAHVEYNKSSNFDQGGWEWRLQ